MRLLAAIGAAALVCTGCSGVGLAYKNADHLALKSLEKLVELAPEQREALGAALEAGLERHRREDLPVLVSRLREARSIVAAGIEPAGATRILALASLTYRETVSALIADVTPVLATLDGAQVDALAARLAEENAREQAEHRDDAPDAPARRTREGIEKWTGRLRKDQRALVQDAQRAIPSRAEAWYAFSKHQAGLLVTSLRGGASTDAIAGRLRSWWIEEDERDAAFRTLTRQALEGWATLLVRLDATLSATQREKAVGRLDRWARGLTGLL